MLWVVPSTSTPSRTGPRAGCGQLEEAGRIGLDRVGARLGGETTRPGTTVPGTTWPIRVSPSTSISRVRPLPSKPRTRARSSVAARTSDFLGQRGVVGQAHQLLVDRAPGEGGPRCRPGLLGDRTVMRLARAAASVVVVVHRCHPAHLLCSAAAPSRSPRRRGCCAAGRAPGPGSARCCPPGCPEPADLAVGQRRVRQQQQQQVAAIGRQLGQRLAQSLMPLVSEQVAPGRAPRRTGRTGTWPAGPSRRSAGRARRRAGTRCGSSWRSIPGAPGLADVVQVLDEPQPHRLVDVVGVGAEEPRRAIRALTRGRKRSTSSSQAL